MAQSPKPPSRRYLSAELFQVSLLACRRWFTPYFYAVKNNIGQSSGEIIGDEAVEELSILTALKKGFFPMSIFLVIIGGILSGIFTPN